MPLRPTLALSAEDSTALLLLSRGWKLEERVFPSLPRLQRFGLASFEGRINRFKITKAGRRLADKPKD